MVEGLIGRKLGMTQLFDEAGRVIPVTVIEAGPCVVVQRKTRERDGYEAAQLGLVEKKPPRRVTQPQSGHFRKAGVPPTRVLRELPLGEGEDVKPGDTVTCAIFEPGVKVDVVGRSKGRGFQGVVKRWGFSGWRKSHGHGKVAHRRPGSIGTMRATGKVFKGKKMAGHMGNEKVCVQNLEVVRVDVERNLLLVKGAVPGARGGDVIVTPAIKLKNKG